MILLTLKRVENKEVIKKRFEAFYKKGKGSFNILSPGIGRFEIKVRNGDFLSPGSYFGTLNLLGSTSRVYLPDNVSGIVELGIRKIR